MLAAQVNLATLDEFHLNIADDFQRITGCYYERCIFADHEVRLHLDALGDDIVNVFLQHFSRQPVRRNGFLKLTGR